jgi:hypothetical protein
VTEAIFQYWSGNTDYFWLPLGAVLLIRRNAMRLEIDAEKRQKSLAREGWNSMPIR